MSIYNTGHGHVNPRPDGMKARCGGPGICPQCSAEYAQLHPEKAAEALIQQKQAQVKRIVANCEIRTLDLVTEAGRVSTKWGDVDTKVGDYIVKDARGEVVMVYDAETLTKEYTELL